MRRIALSLLFFPAVLFAGDASLFRQAQTAIQEGVPRVGIQKLRTFLDGEITPAERQEAELQLATALISTGKTSEAREILGQMEANKNTQFLAVQSFLSEGDWAAVLAMIKVVPEPSAKLYAPTLFARAEAQRGLREFSRADADYQAIENDPLLGKEARLRRADMGAESGQLEPVRFDDFKTGETLGMAGVLSAEGAFLKKDFAAAERQFRNLAAHPNDLTERAWGAVHLGLARSLVAMKRFDEAEEILEKLIETHPSHEQLADIFEELNRVYTNEKNPSASQLRRWSRDSSQTQRQALAIYYQSLFDLRDKGSDAALATLSGWLEKFPAHPLRANVLLQYGNEWFNKKKWSTAVQHFREGLALQSKPDIKANLHISLARALFANSDYSQAAAQFQQAARVLNFAADRLLYNEALCWLRAGNSEKFFATYQAFSDLFPKSLFRQDLLIEEGFLQARAKHFDLAIKILGLFIRDFPGHHRIPDAHLALAEIALADPSRDTSTAQKELALAGQPGASREVTERKAFLQISEPPPADDPESTSKRLALCRQFLMEYPGSSLEPEIHFKMGELYFAKKDYTSAGTQFELISEKFPDSPLLEQARFLAGQAAIRTMNPSSIDGAISLFEQVVRMKGPLQSYARFEQAQVKKNAGALDEAIVLYDDLLNQNPPPDLLPATIAAKGETLYLQAGGKLPEAVNTFGKLAELPGVSRYWRNLALYKKGKALGLLGKKDEMLAAFYDALAAPQDKNETPELFWFYRAGFEAAELLEADEQWRAAIAIYEKLAAAKGPRSTEAKQRIERLRLEHFIWE